jgi:hypothetical protein
MTAPPPVAPPPPKETTKPAPNNPTPPQGFHYVPNSPIPVPNANTIPISQGGGTIGSVYQGGHPSGGSTVIVTQDQYGNPSASTKAQTQTIEQYQANQIKAEQAKQQAQKAAEQSGKLSEAAQKALNVSYQGEQFTIKQNGVQTSYNPYTRAEIKAPINTKYEQTFDTRFVPEMVKQQQAKVTEDLNRQKQQEVIKDVSRNNLSRDIDSNTNQLSIFSSSLSKVQVSPEIAEQVKIQQSLLPIQQTSIMSPDGKPVQQEMFQAWDLNTPIKPLGGLSVAKITELPSMGIETIGGYIYLGKEQAANLFDIAAKNVLPSKQYQGVQRAEAVLGEQINIAGDIAKGVANIGTYFLPLGGSRFVTQIVASGGENLISPFKQEVEQVRTIVQEPISGYEKGLIGERIVGQALTFLGAANLGKQAYAYKKEAEINNPEKNPTVKNFGDTNIGSETSVPTNAELLGMAINKGINNRFTQAQTQEIELGMITGNKAVLLSKISKLDMTPVVTKELQGTLSKPQIQELLIPREKEQGALAGSIGLKSYIKDNSKALVIGVGIAGTALLANELFNPNAKQDREKLASLALIPFGILGAKEKGKTEAKPLEVNKGSDIDIIAPVARVKGTLTIPEELTDTKVNAIIRLVGQENIKTYATDLGKIERIETSLENYKFKQDITKGLIPDKESIFSGGIKAGLKTKGSTGEIETGLARYEQGDITKEQFNSQFKGKAEIDSDGVFSFKEKMTDIDFEAGAINKAKAEALTRLNALNNLESGRYQLEVNIFGKKGEKVDVLPTEMQANGLPPIYSKYEPLTGKNYYEKPSVERTIGNINEKNEFVNLKGEVPETIRSPEKKVAESLSIFRIKDTKAPEGTDAYIADYAVPIKAIEVYIREGRPVIGGRIVSALDSTPVSTGGKSFSIQSFGPIIYDKYDIISQSGEKALKQAGKLIPYDILKKGSKVDYNVPSEKYLAVSRATVLDTFRNKFNLAEEERVREISTASQKGMSNIIIQNQELIGNKEYKPLKLADVLSQDYQLSARGQIKEGTIEVNTQVNPDGKISFDGANRLLDTNKQSINVVSFKQLLDSSLLRKVQRGEPSPQDVPRYQLLLNIAERSKEARESGKITGARALWAERLENQIIKDVKMETGELPNTRQIFAAEKATAKVFAQHPTFIREILTPEESLLLENKKNELTTTQNKLIELSKKELTPKQIKAEQELKLQLNEKIRQSNVKQNLIESGKRTVLSLGAEGTKELTITKENYPKGIFSEYQSSYPTKENYPNNYPNYPKSDYPNYPSKNYPNNNYPNIIKPTNYPKTPETNYPNIITPNYPNPNTPTPTYPNIVTPNYPIVNPPTPITYPNIVPEPKSPYFFPYSKKKEAKKKKYAVEVRRKGIFEEEGQVSENPLLEFSLGKKKVKESLAASFRVKEVETGRIVQPREVKFGFNPAEFYESKKERGVLIQSKNAPMGGRLGSIQERHEIQRAKSISSGGSKSKSIFSPSKSKGGIFS